jgi:hypothetical protein
LIRRGRDALDGPRTESRADSLRLGTEATMNTTTATLITVVSLIGIVAWFDARCLADLAQTSDRDLRYFNRNTWALVIVLSFPLGPMLYLFYGKGPHRHG